MPKEVMPANPNLLLEAHEDRIQKLEDAEATVKSNIAVLTERIDTGFNLLAEKLDGFKDDLRNHATEDKETALRVVEVSNKVDNLERKQKAKAELKASVWKYAWAVILLILGAAVKFAFDALK